MESLFSTTTVLLTDDFTRSCPKKTLRSKLSKLRLVTGIQFTKANQVYALIGTWEQIDAAFELLAHWQSYPDHEPNIKDAELNEKSKFCRCDVAANFVKGQVSALQTESESRIAEIVKQLQKDYSELTDLNITPSNTNEHSGSTKDLENGPLKAKKRASKLKKHVLLQNTANTQESLVSSKPCLTDVKKENYEGDGNEQASPTSNSCLRQFVQENDFSEYAEYRSELSEDKTKSHNKGGNLMSDCRKKSIHYNSGKFEKSKTVRKPGDKGYWSRLKRTDAHQSHECPKCFVVLKNRKRYHEHMRRIHIKEYVCDACGKGFGYPVDLKRHNCPSNADKEIKKENVEFRCGECSYVTVTKKRLGLHIQRVHRLDHQCDMCEKKFGYKRDLEKHIETAHENAVFICDKCSKVYKSKPVFDQHLKTHEEDYVKPSFTCETCSKSFSSKYYLSNHRKNEHLGMKKTYLCQMCGKKFCTRNSYRQHCNAHNNIKPYKCNICGKSFVYHKSLKEHKFMHENIRRFVCTVCDKAFRQRTCLHVHMKTHRQIKDHICSTCGRGFVQKQAMQRHERIHTGVRPYKCLVCEKTFGETSTIRRHMMSHHSKTERDWKEDVHSSLNEHNDYYVFGGTGQNKSFKSCFSSSKDKLSSKLKTTVKAKQGVDAKNSDLRLPSCSGSTSITSSQTSSYSRYQTLQNVQQGNVVYSVPSNQLSPLNDTNPSNISTVIPISSDLAQVLDLSGMTFIATKLPQQSADMPPTVQLGIQQSLQATSSLPQLATFKAGSIAKALNSPSVQCSKQQTVQLQASHNLLQAANPVRFSVTNSPEKTPSMQIGPQQQIPASSNLLQGATLMPLGALSDSEGMRTPLVESSGHTMEESSSAPTLWGLVGYPTYQSQGSVHVYPDTKS